MLTNAEQAVLQCGFAADDALKAYIAIHDRIFAEQATAVSLLKNLFGAGVSFEELLEESQKAHRLWVDFTLQAHRTRLAYRASVSKEEARFLDVLVEYSAAVRAATASLVERQELLLKRKHSPKEVSWQAYTDVQDKYETAVKRYRELGGTLNPLIHRVFDLADARLKTNGS